MNRLIPLLRRGSRSALRSPPRRSSPAQRPRPPTPRPTTTPVSTLGTQAYQYGVPLLDTERIFKSSTSVTVCNPVTGHGPVNQFCSIRNLATASERTVNAPNNDTPYSVAWLDLSKQPMVLHAPPIKNRFWEFELVDPWTNNFYNITSAHLKMGAGEFNVTGGGNWAIVGPALQGQAAARRDPRELAATTGCGSSAAPTSAARRISATCTGSRTNTRSRRCRSSAPTTSRRGPQKIITKSTDGDDSRHPAGRGPTRVLHRARQGDAEVPRPRRRPAAAHGSSRRSASAPGSTPRTRTSAPTRSAACATRSRRARTRSSSAALALYLQGFAKHNGYLVADLGAGARTTRCARSATSSASAASGRASRPTRSHCSTTPRRRSQDRSGTSFTSRRAACRSRSRRSGR